MGLLERLKDRSESQCELCSSTDNLTVFEVKPVTVSGIDSSLLACDYCEVC